MWLIQIFALHAEDLKQVEASIRAVDGVKRASALRDGQPYVVAECPTERDASRIQALWLKSTRRQSWSPREMARRSPGTSRGLTVERRG